ncbi:hypothetical protein MMC10_005928 [Thelotrema lepadinum]|nr:hypothetical protein [Thelotrema lepadinum]
MAPNPNSNPVSNPFLLAADASPQLLPLLRSNPSLASSQDAHGYSLLHALTSYNHIDLLRTFFAEFKPNPNIVDEDGETALFVAESVEAAQCLLEEMSVDPEVRNEEGQTAEEKIRGEGDFVTVADYLKECRLQGNPNETQRRIPANTSNGASSHPPPLPKGMRVNVGTMEEDEVGQEVDQGFKQRIEELAAREDFNGEEGQAQLRELVRDAVRDVGGQERNVRDRAE